MKHDPSKVLLDSTSPAVRFFTRRDLLDENPQSVSQLWQLPAVQKLTESQLENGAWKYHGGNRRTRTSENYDQIETYRVLRELVEKYGLTTDSPTCRHAAEFMFSHQSDEGDFRGIAGNQYLPYYTGGIMELLIKAGYLNDWRIEKGFEWLLSMRQKDGGWAFPIRTVGLNLNASVFSSKTVQPNRSKPFSHLVTGMVLRAFAAHPSYRKTRDAQYSASLLASRFFEPDKYPDRQDSEFWTSFSYPFWFTDLLSGLDSISLIGVDPEEVHVVKALEWFRTRQQENGLWRLRLRIMAGEKEPDAWVTLAICRVFKRFLQH